jgi:hypothetical protein
MLHSIKAEVNIMQLFSMAKCMALFNARDCRAKSRISGAFYKADFRFFFKISFTGPRFTEGGDLHCNL